MKKSLLLCFLVFICLESFSQVKVGLRFAPGVAFSRVKENPQQNADSIVAKGPGFSFFAGPELNFLLGENIVFTTGVWYAVKKAGFSIVNRNFEETSNIQYVQLPVTFKFYTNDIAPDMKLFFQLGATGDVKVSEKARKSQLTLTAADNFKRYKPVDATILLGAGVQLQMGSNTYLFGGITYTRGVVNTLTNKYIERIQQNIKNPEIALGYKPKVMTNLIALDCGIRF